MTGLQNKKLTFLNEIGMTLLKEMLFIFNTEITDWKIDSLNSLMIAEKYCNQIKHCQKISKVCGKTIS